MPGLGWRLLGRRAIPPRIFNNYNRMILRRFFQRARSHSANQMRKQSCLCSTAKRDSFYDDLPHSLNKPNEQQMIDSYTLTRSDKPRRLIRQANMDDSDGEDDASITEKLRRASSRSPANIPMLVVVSFNPDAKGLQKNQIEIQRGFPVNAQFIVNEWLYVRTADNDEGFVPYVCCRPVLRRQSLKQSHMELENSYKPYDFNTSTSHPSKSPSTSIPLVTPPSQKKSTFSNALGSQSCLLQNTLSCRKRQDVTSSSCGGDSGFSDCESSSHHHHHQHPHHRSFDLSMPNSARSSNVRSLRVSSNTTKKQSLIVHDAPLKKSTKLNQVHSLLFRSEASQRIKSELSISSNSAFTQFVKKSINYDIEQESNHYQLSNSTKIRSSYHHGEVSPASSSVSHLRRNFNSCDEHREDLSPSTKLSSTVSSPYIRRTPFARRSLPHHLQPVLKKPLRPMLSSSPDPFQTVKSQNQPHLRHIVLAEPSPPSPTTPSTFKMERHFSDLSLNQIENDCLIPANPTMVIVENRPSLSCSSTSPSASSSDDGSTGFHHNHTNTSRCHLHNRGESVPFAFSASNNYHSTHHHNSSATSSNSFIHNVSITV